MLFSVHRYILVWLIFNLINKSCSESVLPERRWKFRSGRNKKVNKSWREKTILCLNRKFKMFGNKLIEKRKGFIFLSTSHVRSDYGHFELEYGFDSLFRFYNHKHYTDSIFGRPENMKIGSHQILTIKWML